MRLIKSLIIILLTLANCRIVPQSPFPEFRHISMEQGLSQSNVNCILQDSKGFLWLGTKDGLNRYDGYTFRVYQNSPSDSNSISDNYITALAEDKSGNIWAGTLGGKLNCLNSITQQIKVYSLVIDPLFNENNLPHPESLPCYSNYNDASVTSIICDKDGMIWTGTWAKGLFRYDLKSKSFSKHFFFLEDINSLSSNNILSLAQDDSGSVWIGTLGGGLNKLEIKKGKGTGNEEFLFTKNPGIITPGDNISALIINNDNLWIGTFNGLFKLNISSGTIQQINTLLPDYSKQPKTQNSFLHSSVNNPQPKVLNHSSKSVQIKSPGAQSSLKITSLAFDNSGKIWVGTFGNGIVNFDTLTKVVSYYVNNPYDQNSLDDNDVVSIAVDKTGLVWAGTFSGYGVNKLNPQKIIFNYYPAEPDRTNKLSDKIINSFSEDADGNLWIGTYKGGLNKFNRTAQSFEVFKNNPTQNNSISSNYITSVYAGQNKVVWAGTFDNGINLLDNTTGKFTRFKHDPSDNKSISSNQITSIAGDKNHNVWIGTFSGGLNKVIKENNSYRFQNYRKNDLYSGGIPDNGIKGLYNDSDGNLWVAVAGGYLLKYDNRNDEFITYRINVNQNKTVEIISFCDTGYLIWIGTDGNGLLKFNKTNGKFIQEDSYYLSGRVIYGILKDDQNNLWLSSDNGIIKYNTTQQSIAGFNMNDGLQSLRFTKNAYCKTKNGEMFFGGINGFNSFKPDFIKPVEYVPHTGITSFKVMNKEVPLDSDVIYLGYSENSVSFEFSSFDFTDPQKNQYAYKLAGYDIVWYNTTGSNRSVVYNNLPPGEYTFMLKSSGYSSNWNIKPLELKIIISLPLYRKWWFLLLIILTLSGIIGYIFWTRLNHYRSVQQLKEKLSADLHDNIGSGLTEISLLSAIARDYPASDAAKQKDKLITIGDRAGELVDNMSDIVWLVNPKNKSLKDLILRLKDAYSGLCSSLGISFKLMNIEELEDADIIMEKRQNIYLIFKEGINNSIKYSSCRNIVLSVESDNKNYEIILSDDGSGFNIKNNYQGNGLNNMKKRAHDSGMHLDINSAQDHGTVISLKGKLK